MQFSLCVVARAQHEPCMMSTSYGRMSLGLGPPCSTSGLEDTNSNSKSNNSRKSTSNGSSHSLPALCKPPRTAAGRNLSLAEPLQTKCDFWVNSQTSVASGADALSGSGISFEECPFNSGHISRYRVIPSCSASRDIAGP